MELISLIMAGLTTAIGGAILTIVFFVVRKIYFVHKSVIEILRNEIIKIHDKYSEKKKLNKYELEEVSRLYDLYKALSGNGYAESLVMEIKLERN